MIDLQKVKLYSQSWYSSTEYDLLIEDIILNAKSYINELISWQYVPDEYIFNQIAHVENDGKIYLDKKPINYVNSVKINDEEVDYSIDNFASVLKVGCSPKCGGLKTNAYVEYVVGGLTDDYPLAIDNIILDLVLKKLNFAINNAQGFSSNSIGSDISFTFKFEMTEEQKYTIKKYRGNVL